MHEINFCICIIFFFFSNPRKYVMYVRKKIFLFLFPKSFLEKKNKLYNACETKMFNNFLFIFLKIIFLEKIKYAVHVRQKCLLCFFFIIFKNKIYNARETKMFNVFQFF